MHVLDFALAGLHMSDLDVTIQLELGFVKLYLQSRPCSLLPFILA